MEVTYLPLTAETQQLETTTEVVTKSNGWSHLVSPGVFSTVTTLMLTSVPKCMICMH